MGYDKREFDVSGWYAKEAERYATAWLEFRDGLIEKGYPADRADAAAIQITCAHMQAHATKMAARQE